MLGASFDLVELLKVTLCAPVQRDLVREDIPVAVAADASEQLRVLLIDLIHLVIRVLDGEGEPEIVLQDVILEVVIVKVRLRVDAGARVVFRGVKHLGHKEPEHDTVDGERGQCAVPRLELGPALESETGVRLSEEVVLLQEDNRRSSGFRHLTN